ncbi:MAG: hypothetical protein ABFS86_19495, partial [Planctomycetota bacterium]
MTLARAWWSALFVVVLFAPVPIGAIESAWCMPLALAVLALGAGPAVLRPLIAGERPRFPAALAPIALLLLWTALALIPLPRGVVAALSP